MCCLSALCRSWSCGPAGEGAGGRAAAKCISAEEELSDSELLPLVSSEEEWWGMNWLIGSMLGCCGTLSETQPRKWSSHLSPLLTKKAVVSRDLSWPAVGWGAVTHNIQTWIGLVFCLIFHFQLEITDVTKVRFPSAVFPFLPPPTFSHSPRSDHLEILLHLFIMCEFPPRAESVTVLKCDALTHWGRKQRGVGDYNTSWPTLQSLYDLIIFISLYPFLCIPVSFIKIFP